MKGDKDFGCVLGRERGEKKSVFYAAPLWPFVIFRGILFDDLWV